MIFVTLGTQDKSFHRLLERIDLLIEKGIIKDKIIVQAGSTRYQSKNMEIIDFIDINQFNHYIMDCDFLISHAGVGTIINGLSCNKKVIAVARRAKYIEHENDHQIEIVQKFHSLGYILGCIEVDQLEEAIMQLETFVPNPFNQDNSKFCMLLETLINS